MYDVQAAIYTRLKNDTTDTNGSSLKTLLGGDIARVYPGMDWQIDKAPSITFNILSSIPGDIDSDTVMTHQEFFTFRIFANNFYDIAARLRQLLDRYVFAATTKAGVLKCVWDGDGPELFDEELKVRRMDSRYKIYVMPKAIGPV